MAWADLDWTEQDRLRKARTAAGFTELGDLAAASNVTRHTISRWEKDLHKPQAGTRSAVLSVLAERLAVTEPELSRWVETGTLPS